MKIALLSDIHGNDIALKAVLADIDARGPIDEIWILGDLVAIGGQPAEVLARLHALNASVTVRYVRGNTDRFIITGERPPPFLDESVGNRELTFVYAQVNENFAWTEGALSALGAREFIAKLPLAQRIILPDGTRMLGVHSAIGDDAGFGFRPNSTAKQLRELYRDHHADLIFMGHTHLPGERHLKRVPAGDSTESIHLINLGSVSNPLVPHLNATYVLLEADDSGYHAVHIEVPYDRQAVINQIRAVNHPCADYITLFFNGDMSRRYWQGLVPIA